VSDAADWPYVLADGLLAYPGVADLLRFKADSVQSAAAELRHAMDQAGASAMRLGLNGFAPPWSRITGLDYRQVHQVVQATRCKLFTFHWPMITRWWSETLLAWNPGLDEGAVLRAIQAALDLPPPPHEHRRSLADYGMPHPAEPHPITAEALTRKLNQAVRMAGPDSRSAGDRPTGPARPVVAIEGGTPPDSTPRGSCLAYVHSYRPTAEFGQVLEAVLASESPGCWVQRYGYLSDEKLAVMRTVWPG
jgi:hypothetical protein